MTSTWLEDYESEAYDDSEGDYDSEAYDDSESARSDARRRARARRIALARRRMAVVRAGRVPAPTPGRPVTPTQAVSAIRNLDLESKVTEDSLRRALEQANSRARRNTYVTVASTALDQALDSFEGDLAKHDFVRAGLRLGPLFLLAPERRRRGFEGWALDPRVLGAVGVVGIVAAGKFQQRHATRNQVLLTPSRVANSSTVTSVQLALVVRNKDGEIIPNPSVTWENVIGAGVRLSPTGVLERDKTGTWPYQATVLVRVEGQLEALQIEFS